MPFRKKIILYTIITLLACVGVTACITIKKIQRWDPVSANGTIIPCKLTSPEKWENFSEKNKNWLHAAYKHPVESYSPFNGLELDLFCKMENGKAKLYISHDEPSGDELSAWLDKLPDPTAFYYWFDVKNISEENNLSILETIKNTLTCHSIASDKVVIESPNPKALGIFTAADFFTSYYLNVAFDDIDMNKRLFSKYVEEANSCNICAVSCDIYGHRLCRQYFPDMLYLHWGVRNNAFSSSFTEFIRTLCYEKTYKKIAQEKQVRVILISE